MTDERAGTGSPVSAASAGSLEAASTGTEPGDGRSGDAGARGEIIHGDCLQVLRDMESESVDAIVTDPPYGLQFMGKRWDYDVPSPEAFAEMQRVLKDGGRLLCFAGTRTMHRMWCAIEDGGFMIEDSIAWLYGTGFPKHASKLKPAYEPVCVARKGGASPLQVDACRIEVAEWDAEAMERCNTPGSGRFFPNVDKPTYSGGWTNDNRTPHDCAQGRYPANVALDEAAAELLDEQSGDRPSRHTGRPHTLGRYDGNPVDSRGHVYGEFAARKPSGAGFADGGGASRFFYCAKASRSERGEGNVHPTVKPLDLMRWLCRLVSPPGGLVLDPYAGSGTTGVAAMKEGLRFVGIEREAEYVEIARRRVAHAARTPSLFDPAPKSAGGARTGTA